MDRGVKVLFFLAFNNFRTSSLSERVTLTGREIFRLKNPSRTTLISSRTQPVPKPRRVVDTVALLYLNHSALSTFGDSARLEMRMLRSRRLSSFNSSVICSEKW
ncbi:hypothetical protein Trydic_g17355 [Trypoxylus dichotomus]